MSTPDLYWGPPGVGKTQAIIARMVAAAQRGQKSLAFVGDGSGVAYKASGLVDAGVLEVIQYTNWNWPSSVCRRLTEGWVPDSLDPTNDTWVPMPKGTHYGVIAIEGASVMGTYLMSHKKGGMAYRAAKGERLGPDAAIRYVDADLDPHTGLPIKGTGTDLAFGGHGQAHYGQTQSNVVGYIQSSAMLPAEEVIWTAHERGVTEKISQKQFVGPEVSGSAITVGLGKLFGHVLHFTTATKRTRGGAKDAHLDKNLDHLDVEYRIYTRNHVAVDGASTAEYLAISRGVSASDMPAYLTADTPGVAVMQFYEIIARLQKTRAEEIRALLPKG